MNTQVLAILLGVLVLGIVMTLVSVMLSRAARRKEAAVEAAKGPYSQQTQSTVDAIFDDKFRQELRNRGLIHFEKIINENALFLEQDLRLTASQVNEYMKQEIRTNLGKEFSNYQQSIADAKQLAIDSIAKTQAALEQQRAILTKQLEQQFEAAKLQMVQHFQDNMSEIINHYIVAAIGNQIDLNDQLEFIIGELEANKAAIVEDLQHGA